MNEGIIKKLRWQFILFLARRLPACDYMTRMFSDRLERPMTLREKITMRLHLFTCDACKRYVEQIEFMHDNLQPKNEERILEELPAALSSDARERIRAALAAARKN